MVTENEVDNLITNILPNAFAKKHVSSLDYASEWKLESCKWFLWQFKNSLKSQFTGYAMGKFGKFYMPDLGMFGISRFAPMGSRKQRKNMEKIQKEMGSFNEDKLFKDVSSAYIVYLSRSIVEYYVEGYNGLLIGMLKDPNTFVKNLTELTDTLFIFGDDGQEENDEEVWSPYSMQTAILDGLNEDNQTITKENNEAESDDKKRELLVIPDNFDIIEHRLKISPV